MLSGAAVKEKALSIGFDLCGIAPVDGFPELSFLDDWLAQGYAGEMAWMARTAERRADVRNVVPGARSVVVTGICTTPIVRTHLISLLILRASRGMPGATTITTC